MPIPSVPGALASLPILINPVSVSLTATAAGELAPVPTAADPAPPKVVQMSVAPELIAGAALTLSGMGAQWLLQKIFGKKGPTQPEPKRLPPPSPKKLDIAPGKTCEISFWQVEKVLQRLSALSDILCMYRMEDEHKFVTKLVRNLSNDFRKVDKACEGKLPAKISMDGDQIRLIQRLIKAVDDVSAAVDSAFENSESAASFGTARNKIQTLQTTPFVEDYLAFRAFLGKLAANLTPRKDP
ncbi:MAG TPA: hypothetical protein VFX30_07305 [bacterium]|nr:hypothetical protein [bacterium]